MAKLTVRTSIKRYVHIEGRSIACLRRTEKDESYYTDPGRTLFEAWATSYPDNPDEFLEHETLADALRSCGPQSSIAAAAKASQTLFVEMMAQAYELRLSVLVEGSFAADLAIEQGATPDLFTPIKLDEHGISFRFIRIDNPLVRRKMELTPGIYDATFSFETLSLEAPKLVIPL